MTPQQKILKSLIGGGKAEDENKVLLEEISRLKQVIQNMGDIEKKEKAYKSVSIDDYNMVNMQKFLASNTGEELLLNPEVFQYEDGFTAFDKNLMKNPNYYYKYQKEFIEDWSVSAQELVILYYGVGTGKTMIAVNCAEQYLALNPSHYVYFLTPASLVLGVIAEMFKRGIDARRKNSKGENVYNFLSYQQLLRSDFDFKENSLLIVDEVHNLRNFYTKQISTKESGRKWKTTETYSLVGTKLGIKLLEAENKFVRSIFMTGTLFVNDEKDLEPIIALGYKKTPLTKNKDEQLFLINNSLDRMKIYYNGLISFYRRPTDTPNFPKVKYHFELIKDITNAKIEKDPFFVNTRNADNTGKSMWISKFILSHRNEKTLIYAQFLDRTVEEIAKFLTIKKINFKIISGALTAVEKFDIVKEYNDNKVKILIFTLAIKEGISFKETNNFIFTQPYWNYAITEQVIARAIRSDSHKEGNKSVVNVYMLATVSREMDEVDKNQFQLFANNIMNNDIKTYLHEPVKETVDDKGNKHIITKINTYHMKFNHFGKDLDLYLRMFDKQARINAFEQNLLYKVPRFEQSNNIENNEFIEEFNAYILELEQKESRTISNKEKIGIKREMYKKFYDKEINKVNNRIIRLDKDPNFRTNRNPDLELIAKNDKYKDQTKLIKNLLDKGVSLSEILESYDLSKEEITTFQANFTPENEVDFLIKYSGLGEDTRQNLLVLEPTSGIGNVVAGMLKLPNKSSLLIDSVEIHNLFYQIAQAQFDNINNVRLYNVSLFDYTQKYNYDYILGNPPFNVRTQIEKLDKKQGKIVKIDAHYYDVNFVAHCYNMLNENGVLCMIISDRFLRDNSGYFIIFNKWMEYLQKVKPEAIQMQKIGAFKKDSQTTKKMETNFPMVCIRLVKLHNFEIDLSKAPPTGSEEEDKENKKLLAKQKRDLVKASKPPKAPKAPKPKTAKKPKKVSK
jgi:superfamily II DNA or RNA helicase/methylase of polypeptide subunit release factors